MNWILPILYNVYLDKDYIYMQCMSLVLLLVDLYQFLGYFLRPFPTIMLQISMILI